MYERSGDGWRVSADTHEQVLLALYFRDLAGIPHADQPMLCPLSPPVRPVAAPEVPRHGAAELRQEWQQWWRRLLRHDLQEHDGGPAGHPRPGLDALLDPPRFPAFDDSPTLQRLMRAHYGAAFSWVEARLLEYGEVSREHTASGRRAALERLVQDRELESDLPAASISLNLVELPLAEPRAWFVEPRTVIMSQELPRHEELFRSYLQPIVGMLQP